MEYTIRFATGEDLDKVIQLAVDLVHRSISPYRSADPKSIEKYRREDLEGLKASLDSPNVGVFIAEDPQKKFLGHVIVMTGNQESSTGESQGYVFDLSVIPSMQGRGIGRNLMKIAERFCRVHGMKYVCLNVTSSNETAVNFYQNIGYEEERKRMIKVLPAVDDDGDEMPPKTAEKG